MATSPLPPLFALSLVIRRFSTMLNAGVSLVRILARLAESAPLPYAEALGRMQTSVTAGATLTRAMQDESHLFPLPLLPLVRAGEVGGVLDVTLERAADLLELAFRYQDTRTMLGEYPTIRPCPLPPRLSDLSARDQALVCMLVFRTFGILLHSGVPILQSMELVAELWPPAERAEWLGTRAAIREGGSHLEVDFLPTWIGQLLSIGEETGTLDAACLTLGETLEHEVKGWERIGRMS
jgi:type II secretory pathway component PulF